MHLKSLIACFTILAVSAHAATFGFSTIIRAGLSNSGDWELGIGPENNNSQFNAQLTPYYPNNQLRNFEIGYRSANNQAFVRFQPVTNGAWTEAAFNPIGGAPLTPTATWTLPSTFFYIQASGTSPVTTGVSLSNVSLSGSGLTVLSSPGNFTASVARTGNTSSNWSPSTSYVFRSSTGGSWTLSGQLSFLGLSAYLPSGGQRSQLHFALAALAADTPEAGTTALAGLGLVVLAMLGRQNRKKA
jgi:hypothetical protein